MDFSKLAGLFRRNVGAEQVDTSLLGMFRHALVLYKDRVWELANSDDTRFISYQSRNPDSAITIDVNAKNNLPGIVGIHMNGTSCDFRSLLSNFRGMLSAEYTGLEIESLKQPAPFRRKDIVTIDNLAIFIADNLVKRVELVKPKWAYAGRGPAVPYFGVGIVPGISFAYSPAHIEDVCLEDKALELLSQAQKIILHNQFHNAGKRDKNLIIENCVIRHPKEDRYTFAYQAVSPNTMGLPQGMMTALSKVFSLIEKDFDPRCLYRPIMREPGETSYG